MTQTIGYSVKNAKLGEQLILNVMPSCLHAIKQAKNAQPNRRLQKTILL